MVTKIKKVLFLTAGLLLVFAPWFVFSLRHGYKAVGRGGNMNFSNQAGGLPPDILSATNLEQWKFLIKDLKQDRSLRDHWMTSRFRAEITPVLINYNGQSIIYKAEAVDVSVLPKTIDFMEAQIYSPKMSVDDTRALGLSLCNMFGFDSNKLLSWCDKVGTNWMDMPAFNLSDQSHFFNVRRSYNNQKPWYIIFTVQDQRTLSTLMKRFPQE